jgi:hypothetical protein
VYILSKKDCDGANSKPVVIQYIRIRILQDRILEVRASNTDPEIR